MTDKPSEYVTTITTYCNDIQTLLTAYSRVAFIPAAVITKHIPYNERLRVKTSFNILVIVKLLGSPSRAAILQHGMLGIGSTQYALAYLVRLGFIRTCGKPRLIKPFQRYKIDTGYVITPLGEKTIIAILSGK